MKRVLDWWFRFMNVPAPQLPPPAEWTPTELEQAMLVDMDTGACFRMNVARGIPRVYVPTILGSVVYERSPLPPDGFVVYTRSSFADNKLANTV